ncbi:CopG family transcriptional regulator [Conexibacter stalactiti]|uniref:CopG family transcriptional regulator n=1 Tax=Conexibacter stalactiti TaxID=1940611 RepID=A0ABU4HPS6_9ACTN|nr:CopG family transcriptional regulator [Conexibacter stalactiti]MDW5595328.1 CopG family transcriptional regulator [Conexibacter stalactiti]MEC5035970.1 CopG family transcriptional regulator [Conexibacter stalactiti]
MNANMLNRRTQVLLDDERYVRLERVARESGRSVGAVIREAIDAKFAREDLTQRRRAAADWLLALPTPEEPEPDWAVTKAEMLDSFGAPPA